MRWVLLVLTFFSLHSFAAPSFDCNKAKTAVEKDICTHPKTAELDSQLAKVFLELKSNPAGRLKVSVADLIKDQKKWLNNRDHNESGETCLDNCLETKYSERLKELSFPGAPLPLDDKKVKEIEAFFTDKTCEDVPTEGSSVIAMDGLDQFSCKLYESNPKLANKLFSSCYGGNRDNFTPRCDYSSEIKKADGLEELTNHLSFLYGGFDSMCGTLRYAHAKVQSSTILMALNDLQVPNEPSSDSGALKHFSLQGIWEKQQYDKYLQLKEKAQQGLEKYYIEFKHASPDLAKNAAQYHINQLADTYVSISPRNNWDLKEVNKFLQTGELPDNKDYNYEEILYNYEGNALSKAQAKPDILAYFLKLAITNNYPKHDIEKIISAGANLQSKLGDAALMNSVTRPDIMQLLIEKGARVNAQNTFGKTPLMYAIQYGNLAAVKILVEHQADVNLATFAEMEPNCEFAGIKAGNRTPLMYAAWHADIEVVKYLLSKGAKPEVKDTGMIDAGGHDYTFYLKNNDYHQPK